MIVSSLGLDQAEAIFLESSIELANGFDLSQCSYKNSGGADVVLFNADRLSIDDAKKSIPEAASVSYFIPCGKSNSDSTSHRLSRPFSYVQLVSLLRKLQGELTQRRNGITQIRTITPNPEPPEITINDATVSDDAANTDENFSDNPSTNDQNKQSGEFAATDTDELADELNDIKETHFSHTDSHQATPVNTEAKTEELVEEPAQTSSEDLNTDITEKFDIFEKTSSTPQTINQATTVSTVTEPNATDFDEELAQTRADDLSIDVTEKIDAVAEASSKSQTTIQAVTVSAAVEPNADEFIAEPEQTSTDDLSADVTQEAPAEPSSEKVQTNVVEFDATLRTSSRQEHVKVSQLPDAANNDASNKPTTFLLNKGRRNKTTGFSKLHILKPGTDGQVRSDKPLETESLSLDNTRKNNEHAQIERQSRRFFAETRLLGLILSIIKENNNVEIRHPNFPPLQLFPQLNQYASEASILDNPQLFRTLVVEFQVSPLNQTQNPLPPDSWIAGDIRNLIFQAAYFGSEGRLMENSQLTDTLSIVEQASFDGLELGHEQVHLLESMLSHPSFKISNLMDYSHLPLNIIVNTSNALEQASLLTRTSSGIKKPELEKDKQSEDSAFNLSNLCAENSNTSKPKKSTLRKLMSKLVPGL